MGDQEFGRVRQRLNIHDDDESDKHGCGREITCVDTMSQNMISFFMRMRLLLSEDEGSMFARLSIMI